MARRPSTSTTPRRRKSWGRTRLHETPQGCPSATPSGCAMGRIAFIGGAPVVAAGRAYGHLRPAQLSDLSAAFHARLGSMHLWRGLLSCHQMDDARLGMAGARMTQFGFPINHGCPRSQCPQGRMQLPGRSGTAPLESPTSPTERGWLELSGRGASIAACAVERSDQALLPQGSKELVGYQKCHQISLFVLEVSLIARINSLLRRVGIWGCNFLILRSDQARERGQEAIFCEIPRYFPY